MEPIVVLCPIWWGFPGYGKHIFQYYFRMMVSLIPGSFFAVLYCFFRAPLNTGKALFTFMQPHWFIRVHFNVPTRANLFTDAAGVTFSIGPKIFIQRRDVWERKFIKPGEKNILPKGAFLHGIPLPFRNNCRNSPDLFCCVKYPPHTHCFRSRPAPRYVVGRHADVESGGET